MDEPTFYRNTRQRRVHEPELTYKVLIGDRIRVRQGTRGRTYRVCWLVASRRRGRTFRTLALAKSFQAMLATATAEGRPFDVKSGLPLSSAPDNSVTDGHGRPSFKCAPGRHG